MHRAIPTNNKLCFDKDLKRNWKIHQEKLKSIRSNLSQTAPKSFLFLDQRAKKAALEEVRSIEIEKENNCLLEKIKTISSKGKRDLVKVMQKKKTLNEPYRKRVLVKIVEENQELLKRIQQKRSLYNVRKWEKQRKNVQKNITLISEYPYKNYPSTQTKCNLWMTDEDFTKKSRVTNLNNSRIQSTRLVFSGTQKIGQSYYLVESYLNKKIFNIEIENLETSSEKYRMEMPESEAQQLLHKKFNNELRYLLQSLEIDHNEGICYLKYRDSEA